MPIRLRLSARDGIIYPHVVLVAGLNAIGEGTAFMTGAGIEIQCTPWVELEPASFDLTISFGYPSIDFRATGYSNGNTLRADVPYAPEWLAPLIGASLPPDRCHGAWSLALLARLAFAARHYGMVAQTAASTAHTIFKGLSPKEQAASIHLLKAVLDSSAP